MFPVLLGAKGEGGGGKGSDGRGTHSGSDDNSGSRGLRDRSGGSQVRSDRSASCHSGVTLGVVTAQALEVLNGLGDSLVRVSVRVQAVVDVADKSGVGAVARGVGVVDAADDVVPRGNASGNNGRVGEGLGGGRGRGDDAAGNGDGDGGGTRLLLRRGGGGLNRGRGCGRSAASLSHGVAGRVDRGLRGGDRADRGRNGNDNSGQDGALALGVSGAVSDSRSARSDSLDACGVDGRGANEAGQVGAAGLVGGRVGRNSLAGAGDSAGAGWHRSRLGHGRVGGGRRLRSRRAGSLSGRRRGLGRRRRGRSGSSLSRRSGNIGSRGLRRRGLAVGLGVVLAGLRGRRRRLGLSRGLGVGVGRRGLSGLGHRAGGRATGERNSGHADGASRRLLGNAAAALAGGVDDGDVLRTTALAVLDGRTLR